MSQFAFSSLDDLRKRLLDLTAHNPLISYKFPKESIRLYDISSQQIVEATSLDFKHIPLPTTKELIQQGIFRDDKLPTAEQWAKFIGIELNPELPKQSSGTSIQTALYPNDLDKKINGLRLKANAAAEEMGADILYLILGFLQWTDPASQLGKKFLSPLITLPVEIVRENLRNGRRSYKLKIKNGELVGNLTLKQKFLNEFDLLLPEIGDEQPPEDYFHQIENIVQKNYPDWAVLRQGCLGLLNFSKQAMYQDLNPETHTGLAEHPIISQLFSTESREITKLEYLREYALDDMDGTNGKPNIHILFPLIDKADSSQHSALIDAIEGKNLVIEGPPGSGKSQTITNLIAACLNDGKSVLFVAEKMAALNVVKDRMDKVGLGEFCLELHSHKSNKQKILDDLVKKYGLHQRDEYTEQHIEEEIKRFEGYKKQLSDYSNKINELWGSTRLTIQQILSGAVRYRRELSLSAEDVALKGWGSQNLTELARADLYDQAEYLRTVFQKILQQSPNQSLQGHFWFGVEKNDFLDNEASQLNKTLADWTQSLHELENWRKTFDERFSSSLTLQTIKDWQDFSIQLSELPTPQGDEVIWADLCNPDFQDTLTGLLREFDTLQQQWQDLATVFVTDNLANINVADFQSNLAVFQSVLPENATLDDCAVLVHQITSIQEKLANLNPAAPEALPDELTNLPDDLLDVADFVQDYQTQYTLVVQAKNVLSPDSVRQAAQTADEIQAALTVFQAAGNTPDSTFRQINEIYHQAKTAQSALAQLNPNAYEPLPDELTHIPTLQDTFNTKDVKIFAESYQAQHRCIMQTKAVFHAEIPTQLQTALHQHIASVQALWGDDITIAQLFEAGKQIQNLLNQSNELELALSPIRPHIPNELAALFANTPQAWQELNTLVSLIKCLPSELWALRDNAFTQPETENLLNQLSAVLHTLATQHHALERLFDLTNLPDADELQDYLDQLESGGLLKFFSSERREAKSALQALARRKSTKFEELKNALPDLIAYRQVEEKAQRIARQSSLLQKHYRGKDTLIGKLKTVQQWYQAVFTEYGAGFGERAAWGNKLFTLNRQLALNIARTKLPHIETLSGSLKTFVETYPTIGITPNQGLDSSLKIPFEQLAGCLKQIKPYINSPNHTLHAIAAAIEQLPQIELNKTQLAQAHAQLIADTAPLAQFNVQTQTALHNISRHFPNWGTTLAQAQVATEQLVQIAQNLPDLQTAHQAVMSDDAPFAKALAQQQNALQHLQHRVTPNRHTLAALNDAATRLKRTQQAQSALQHKYGELTVSLPDSWLFPFSSDTRQAIDNSLKLIKTAQSFPDIATILTVLPNVATYSELVQFAPKLADLLQSADQQQCRFQQQGEVNLTQWCASPKIIELIAKNQIALDKPEWLSEWAKYPHAKNQLVQNGADNIIACLEQGSLKPEQIHTAMQTAIYYQMAKEIYAAEPKLRQFRGESHNTTIAHFKEYDQKIMELQRKHIAAKAASKPIPYGVATGAVSRYSEMALIKHEKSKNKRHIPLRKLLSRAPQAIQALKPCFMMSPMSVAQYLPPQLYQFDVVIMDEASQILPEDALGTLARVHPKGGNIVIVGDLKQLAPSNFFKTLIEGTDGDDKEEEEKQAIQESESILEAAMNHAAFVTRRLRWHYRSRHESLIAFSNKHFYDLDLILFPSPIQEAEDLGIRLHKIKGYFSKGINIIEAKSVAECAANILHQSPNESLGIVAMNAKQRDEIEMHFQQILDERPDLQALCDQKAQTAPVFIKNLENVQGDERDIVLISMTYAPEKIGERLMQRFGPINNTDGWRRLNVLFTRSKKQMHIFSSMSSSDIILSEKSSRGVEALQAFLEYCERGHLHQAKITGKAPDSDFEIAVMDALAKHGYACEPQVGVNGYFIDLAVRNPNQPNQFFMGIECDGATYHSAKSARDRDILRQENLENLGWEIRRIWSTDWFRNPEAALKPILERLNELKQASVSNK